MNLITVLSISDSSWELAKGPNQLIKDEEGSLLTFKDPWIVEKSSTGREIISLIIFALWRGKKREKMGQA